MTDQTGSPSTTNTPQGNLTPSTYVSAEEYMEKYAHDFYEWVDGELEAMPPVTGTHDKLSSYLRMLIDAYLALNPIGVTRQDPFVMRLDVVNSRHEPDLQVILHTNSGELTETAMIGPANICIEVVSPESVARDYGKKFTEYEKGGVREYWLIDPIRTQAVFYRLNDKGILMPLSHDQDGNYETPILPRLKIHVPTLWIDSLPNFFEIASSIQAMLSDQPTGPVE